MPSLGVGYEIGLAESLGSPSYAYTGKGRSETCQQ